MIKKQGATRNSDPFEIIHTNVNGPYSPLSCDNKYFITFVDGFPIIIIFIR